MASNTFILTLELDPDSFRWLDDLRRRHFPPDRNLLSAHLTLFHTLDLTQVSRMTASLRDSPSPLPLQFTGLRSLGGGVAIEVASPELHALRASFVAAVDGDLSRQDKQGFRPHVTIQNKVTAGEARDLMAMLQRDFVPRTGRGVALQVWRYLNGPWALHERLELR